MKVIHVLNELRYSGAELMLLAAGPEWFDRGIELEVLEVSASPGLLGPTFASAGWGHRQLPKLRRDQLIKEIRRVLGEARPDVVHAHSEWSVLPIAVAARSLGIPVLRTVHHIFLWDDHLRRRAVVKRRFTRTLGVLHATNSLANQINELEAHSNPSVLIPNWVSQQPAPTAAREARSSRPVILSVGGCSEYKNHDEVIAALAEMPEQVRPEYIHIGPENSLTQEEMRLAQSLGVSDDIAFEGVVADLAPYLARASLLVQPSREEGFGVAIADALVGGVPVLLSDRPAHNSVFDHLPGVYWCEPTHQAIAHSLLALCGRSPEPTTPDQAWTRHSFSVQEGAARYAYIYNYLVRRSDSRSIRSALSGAQQGRSAAMEWGPKGSHGQPNGHGIN